jgi:hypothetical protein
MIPPSIARIAWSCQYRDAAFQPHASASGGYNAFAAKMTSKNMMNHFDAGSQPWTQAIENT